MTLDINIERIANFIDRHLQSIGVLENGVPPFSSIEFSNNALCNRRCFFCPRSDAKLFPNRDEHLSFGLFAKVMDELASIDYCGRISFSGFCEPLLTKDLERYIVLGKRRCPRMTIEVSTNGDPLTEERLRSLFAAGLDNIRVSLYDGPQQDAKFQELKDKTALSDKQLIVRARYLSARETYGLTISNRAGAITLADGPVHLSPLAEPLPQACHYPFYKMMVDYDGQVMICSNDWLKRLLVGDLRDQTVFDVWNGELFTRVRKSLINNDRAFSPCDVCDVNGLLNGQTHFDAWVQYYGMKEKRKGQGKGRS